VSADEIVYILDESDEKKLDLNKPVETDQNFQSERKPVMQKQKHIIEEDNGSDDQINTQSTSVVTNKSLFKIPNSQTQQMIANKSTSNLSFGIVNYANINSYLNFANFKAQYRPRGVHHLIQKCHRISKNFAD